MQTERTTRKTEKGGQELPENKSHDFDCGHTHSDTYSEQHWIGSLPSISLSLFLIL